MKTKIMAASTLVLMFAQTGQALSIDWGGGYRFEYTDISNTSLSDPKDRKNYALNYLYLQPRIIGSDGINIIGRFDIFGNEHPAYRNSQMGSFLGNGLNPSTGGVPANGANTTSETSNAFDLRVSQLYLNVDHEYGALVLGRAPIEFGMGITYNAGYGPFDHWADTRDMVGYRIHVDNVSFMPILSKVYQDTFGLGKTISEQTFILEYNNKEIGARAGAIHSTRKSGDAANDADTAGYPDGLGGVATVKTGGFKSQTVNVFLERKWKTFEFRLEGSFLTGNTGVQYSSGEEIDLNAYAVAGEVLFPALDSKWEYSGKFGLVSGDDPTTAKYEGYQLDRNYDVALLMFNHRLGKEDFLTTGILHHSDGIAKKNQAADDEAVGNAMYLAPSVKYLWSEKVDLKATLVYAQLATNPNNLVDMKKDLGLELDTELIYRPRERVTWSTGLGFLFPGSAWKAGNLYDNKMTYGLVTKAAITF